MTPTTKPHTKTAHTPWTARPSGDGDGLWTVEDANSGIVFFGMEKDRANLFAAAPELFASLRGMFCPRPCNGRPDDLDVGDCYDAGECGCLAGVALDKAEGRS